MWQQWINGLLGIWLIVLPFAAGLGTGVTWALVITGAAITVLGFWGIAAHKEIEHRTA